MLTLELSSRIVHMSGTHKYTHAHTEMLQTFMLKEYGPRLLHGIVQALAL